MLLQDKILLRKRALVETVNDELKNVCQIEHTRHRSFENFLTNLLQVIAYSLYAQKTDFKNGRNLFLCLGRTHIKLTQLQVTPVGIFTRACDICP